MNYKKHIIKYLPKKLLSIAFNLRYIIRYFRAYTNVKPSDVSGKSAMIVAPHPDDETFGCGGLIALKVAAGAAVRIVLLTDGEQVESASTETKIEIIEARRKQFIDACEQLGLDAGSALKWLHLPDGNIPHPGQAGFQEATIALCAEIDSFSPDEIYCPHFQDVNCDHVASTHLTFASRNLAKLKSSIFYYPIWMLYLNSKDLRMQLDLKNAFRLDISKVVSVKHRAIAAYLDAPSSANGSPYCGNLPWALLWSFRRPSEIFFKTNEIC